MILAARGSLRAQAVWLGALSFIVSNAVLFAYGAHCDPLFLISSATLSLASQWVAYVRHFRELPEWAHEDWRYGPSRCSVTSATTTTIVRGQQSMNILIAVASRHSSTRQIAEAIGQELGSCGHAVQVRSAAEADSADPYDAAIVGSALYMGNWLDEARQFVEKHRATLSAVPVWLFSSGPLGRDEPTPPGDFAHLPELMRATRARGHRTFVGKLDKGDLGVGERLVAKLVKAPDGDFRDWEAIRGWAREIASALPAPVPSGS